MTYWREIFRELGPVKTVQSVKVAGDRVLPVTGVGTIDIVASVNNKLVDRQLREVLLVPDLKRNLFSVGAISDKSFSFHTYKVRCEVRERDGTLSAEGTRCGHFCRMCFSVKGEMECNLVVEKALKLWHERQGHITTRAIKETEETGVVDGLKISGRDDSFFCEACTLGKQSKRSYISSTRERIKKSGEMIHSDICGPVSVESPRGSRYFLLFKDNITGFRTVYAIRNNTEVFEKFKE